MTVTRKTLYRVTCIIARVARYLFLLTLPDPCRLVRQVKKIYG
jgi:hypothetical protein